MSRAPGLEAALACIDDAELIGLTRDLVRIPSVVRPGDPEATEAVVAAFVERWSILFHELGIPIVTCGPGNRLIPHQVNEYVEVGELSEAARIYVAASLRYLAA